jgi:hypothetical protein
MASLRVRIAEGADQQPTLLWDSIWQPWKGQSDWAIADADEPQNRGGLRAKGALHTAIILSLFTDKRIKPDHPLFYLVEDGDPRGWFGDGEDIHQPSSARPISARCCGSSNARRSARRSGAGWKRSRSMRWRR